MGERGKRWGREGRNGGEREEMGERPTGKDGEKQMSSDRRERGETEREKGEIGKN